MRGGAGGGTRPRPVVSDVRPGLEGRRRHVRQVALRCPVAAGLGRDDEGRRRAGIGRGAESNTPGPKPQSRRLLRRAARPLPPPPPPRQPRSLVCFHPPAAAGPAAQPASSTLPCTRLTVGAIKQGAAVASGARLSYDDAMGDCLVSGGCGCCVSFSFPGCFRYEGESTPRLRNLWGTLRCRHRYRAKLQPSGLRRGRHSVAQREKASLFCSVGTQQRGYLHNRDHRKDGTAEAIFYLLARTSRTTWQALHRGHMQPMQISPKQPPCDRAIDVSNQ